MMLISSHAWTGVDHMYYNTLDHVYYNHAKLSQSKRNIRRCVSILCEELLRGLCLFKHTFNFKHTRLAGWDIPRMGVEK